VLKKDSTPAKSNAKSRARRPDRAWNAIIAKVALELEIDARIEDNSTVFFVPFH
jgi:hypothetical protein